jgi:hypothetical protein
MGAVVAASFGPVVAAGSVDSDERIQAVQRSGAWAFTVGSAVFDHAFPAPASAAAQVDHVLGVVRGWRGPGDRPPRHAGNGRPARIGSGSSGAWPAGGRPRRLRIGRTEATWDGGGSAWIRVDGVEVLRGILLTARGTPIGGRSCRRSADRSRPATPTRSRSTSKRGSVGRARGRCPGRVSGRPRRPDRGVVRRSGRVIPWCSGSGCVVLHPADAAGPVVRGIRRRAR